MNKPGFTLVELVIVVVILGLLAAIAMPRLSSATTHAKYQSTHQGFRNIAAAIDLYHADHMGYPPNAPIAGFPPELEGYLHPSAFTAPPPISRAWDWNGPGSGINHFGVNLSIHTTPPADRRAMERRFDDDNPDTGLYRNQGKYLVWPITP